MARPKLKPRGKTLVYKASDQHHAMLAFLLPARPTRFLGAGACSDGKRHYVTTTTMHGDEQINAVFNIPDAEAMRDALDESIRRSYANASKTSRN